ncbi:MAG: hypothetical protein RIQ54_307 [Candidatus Parcubacteria bacterium]|jgi:citrate lyase beta subunit
MKKKLLGYAVIPVAGLSLLGASMASAAGLGFGGVAALSPDQISMRQQTMFQTEAQILGITVDEVKNAWAQGKNIMELAQEKGITREQLQEKMKEVQIKNASAHLQVLVDKGVITQAQADQRLQTLKNNKNTKKGFGHRLWNVWH